MSAVGFSNLQQFFMPIFRNEVSNNGDIRKRVVSIKGSVNKILQIG